MSYIDKIDEWTRPLNSPLYKVSFSNVGHTKASWDLELREHELNHNWLIQELRRGGGLMSRDIELIEDNDDPHKLGVFVGLVRKVGEVTLTKLNQTKT